MAAIEQPATQEQAQPAGDVHQTPVWHMVIADMHQRSEFGAKKYGQHLVTENGRDHLVDAYQEVLDLAVYVRAEIERRGRARLRLEAAMAAMRKDGNGLTLTQEQIILAAAA